MLDIRQRTGYLFLAVMVAQVILVSAQVQSKSGVRILSLVTFEAFSHLERAASGGISGTRGVWDRYVALRGLRSENDELKKELASLQVKLQEEHALAERTTKLQELLDLKTEAGLPTIAAEVIAGNPNPGMRTVTINRGSADGVQADMSVIGPAGVIGRVVGPPARHAARVQLLIDRNAAAGAIVERTRAQGVVVGGGNERLQMQYVSEASDIAVGDVVVTSGIDGIYPKGFIIGRVETVEKNGPAFKRIVVKPAVDFSQLEEVLVVLTPTPAKEAAAGVSE